MRIFVNSDFKKSGYPGMLIFIGKTGGAVVLIVTGRLYDINQSYKVSFHLLIVAATLTLILAFLLETDNRRE